MGVFNFFFKFYKWYQIAQNVCYWGDACKNLLCRELSYYSLLSWSYKANMHSYRNQLNDFNWKSTGFCMIGSLGVNGVETASQPTSNHYVGPTQPLASILIYCWVTILNYFYGKFLTFQVQYLRWSHAGLG